jgi:hypothetical protein
MTVIRINGSSTGNQPQGSDVQSDISLELTELTNVDATTGLQNNSILKYNSSNSMWMVGSDTDTGLTAVVQDPSPELGGDLDVLTRSIVSSSARDITLAPDGAGLTNIKNAKLTSNLDVNQQFITNSGVNAVRFDTPIEISGTNGGLAVSKSDDSANAGPVLQIKRTSTSPDTDDLLGQLRFMGVNDADQVVDYASITAQIGRKTDGSERGLINFNAINNGADETVMTMSRKGLFLNAGNDLYFDGSTDDAFNTQLSATDPNQNRLIRLPNQDGTLLIDDSDSGLLKLQKADDGAGEGPDIRLERTSASPAQSDLLGSIQFQGNDSAGNLDTYSSITGQIERTTSGGERGRIRFNCMADGSAETIATMNRNGLFFGPGNKIAFAGTTDNNNFVTLQAASDPAGFRTIGLPDSDGTVMLNLSEDTSPQLGSDLDVNGNKIVSASNGNIEVDPNGTGRIKLLSRTDIEGTGADNHTVFISTDMSADTSEDLHNAIQCNADYTGINIGSATKQQSITFGFDDDGGSEQAGRFNCEFTRTDTTSNKMKLIAIDYSASNPSNGQIDVTPKRGAINVPFELPTYAVGSLPTTGIGAGAIAYATGLNSSDVSTGKAMVFYDGSNWKYMHIPQTTARS